MTQQIQGRFIGEQMDVALDSLEDTAGETHSYYGSAAPGTAAATAAWQIQRETKATGEIRYAGAGDFAHAWTDRATLTYGGD